MKKQPKVSVVVPFYNRRFCVEGVYRSLCRQTQEGAEFVFVDDGSTDDTKDLIRRIEAHDTRVKAVYKKNGGAGSARNAGIDVADGEYIAFLDSDDCFASENTLSMLYEMAHAHDVGIAGGSLYYVKRGKQIKSSNSWLPPSSNKEYPPAPNHAITPEENEYLAFGADGVYTYSDYQFDAGFTRFIYSKKMLSENGIEFPERSMYEDPVFFVRAMDCAGAFYATKQPTYIWTIGWHPVELTEKDIMAKLDGIQENLEYSKEHSLGLLHWITAAYRLMRHEYMDLRLLLLGSDVRRRFLEVTSCIDTSLTKAYGVLPGETLMRIAENDMGYSDLSFADKLKVKKKLMRIRLVRSVKSSAIAQKAFLKQ